MTVKRRFRSTYSAGSQMRIASGSTSPFPFIQYNARNVLALVAGFNSAAFTYSNLLSDFTATSNRFCRLKSVTFRFYPPNLVTPQVPPSVQIAIVDPISGAFVPTTRVHPLSNVNPTVLVGSLPQLGWTAVTSISNALQLNIQTTAISSITFDIESLWEISQDALS